MVLPYDKLKEEAEKQLTRAVHNAIIQELTPKEIAEVLIVAMKKYKKEFKLNFDWKKFAFDVMKSFVNMISKYWR